MTETNTKPIADKSTKKKKLIKKKTLIIFLFAALALGLMLGAVINHFQNSISVNIEPGACSGGIFLDHCFDIESKYYGVNIVEEKCDLYSWILVNKIRFMEEKNISIWGVEGCDWSQKQIEEFSPYQNYIKANIYYDCANKNIDCSNISITPTWKENNISIAEGYIPLNNLKIRMEFVTNKSICRTKFRRI